MEGKNAIIVMKICFGFILKKARKLMVFICFLFIIMPVIAQVKGSNSNQAVNEVRTFSKARVMNVGHLLMGFEYAYKHSELMPFSKTNIEYDKEKRL